MQIRQNNSKWRKTCPRLRLLLMTLPGSLSQRIHLCASLSPLPPPNPSAKAEPPACQALHEVLYIHAHWSMLQHCEVWPLSSSFVQRGNWGSEKWWIQTQDSIRTDSSTGPSLMLLSEIQWSGNSQSWCVFVVQSLKCPTLFRPHRLQHARLPFPSLSPRVCSNSCPLSQLCHPATCPLSSPSPAFILASGSFPNESALSIQSTGTLASASVLPVNIQDWFPLGWTGLISLQSKGLSRVFSSITFQKHQFFGTQPSSRSNSRIHTPLTMWTFVGEMMSLLLGSQL